MSTINQIEFDRIAADPSSAYLKPEDVLRDGRLSREQKISILKLWAFDAREIEVAQGENMIGEASPLHQILLLLRDFEGRSK